jgi:ribosomal protein L13
MIRCSKCNIEKEKDKFQTYWHSTQQKHHTRKECTECFYKQRNERKRLKRLEDKLNKVSIPTEIIQPEVPELEIDYSNNPEYKQCIGCKEYKLKNNFYKDGRESRFNRCKACIKIKDNKEREQELIENGGSLQISPTPNTYKDKYQKELVFQFLPLCGWKFNEDKGIWWKPGIKNEDGTFVNIKPYKKKISNITKEQVQQMLQYKRRGMKIGLIAGYMGLSISNVSFWLQKYEKEKSNGTH